LLTPELFGQYNYLLALVSLFVIFGEFGLNTSTSKYVAEYRVKNKDKIGSIIFSSITICFILSLIISIINYTYVIYLIPLIFLVCSVNIFGGVYRGLQKFKKFAIISSLSGLIALISAFFLIQTYGIIGAILVQIFYYSIFLIILVLSTKEIRISFDKEISKKIFNFSVTVGITSLAYFLYTRVDIIILQHFGYTVEIGYYEIINKIFQFIIIPFVMAGHVLGPDITMLLAKNDIVIISKRAKIILIFSIGLSTILTVLCYFILPFLVKTFLMDYYDENFIYMLSILLFILPLRLTGAIIQHGFVNPMGYTYISRNVLIPFGILNVILDFFLISAFGFIGVIYATLITYSLCICITYYIFFRKIGAMVKCS
jgi:O-antigen/teichoic acid export membrane protein